MKYRIISFFAYWFARLVYGSLRLTMIGEGRVQQAQAQGKGVILVTWHGRTLIPIARFRKRGYWAIVSTSRDGEYQDGILRRFGWQTVRGSSSARGAVRAVIAMARHLREGDTLAFAPDGPRGPSRQIQPGAIFLAQKSGSPIIPAGIAALPNKSLSAWDRFLLPLPFARAAFIYGDAMEIPANASPEELQCCTRRLAQEINALEDQAERLVRGGKLGQQEKQKLCPRA